MTRIIALSLLAALITTSADATPMRRHVGAYELQVLSGGRQVRNFWHEGETWVLGRLGERYTLRVLNHSARPIEAVVSVDGKDVVDGGPGDVGKRGYLVPAYGSVDIDGWRISFEQAAAFRFSSVADSYAARTGTGREVGVIGVAIFQERPPVVAYVPPPRPEIVEEEPYPWSEARRQAMPDDSASGRGGDAPAPATAAEPAAPVAAMPPSAPAPSAGKAMTSPEPRRSAPAHRRAGLGTEYGEAVASSIRETEFERASTYPATVIGCRYNDRAGLIALGINVDGLSEAVVRRTADPFPTVDRGFAQPPVGWTP